MFCCYIRATVLVRNLSGGRGDEYEMPFAMFGHEWDERLDGSNRAHHIDIISFHPNLWIRGNHGVKIEGATGIADEELHRFA